MRHAIIAVIVAVLALPGAAAGDTEITSPTDLLPTAAQLAHAERVARAYWHSDPPCGAPAILVVPLAPLTVNGRTVFPDGEATGPCEILLDRAEHDWRDFPEVVCVVVAHEWGHLVLGPAYFAAVNPTDPAHSPDPSSIMYAHGPLGGFAPCSEIVAVHKHHRRRHRHHHHHRR